MDPFGRAVTLAESLERWSARQWAEFYIGLDRKVPYGIRDALLEQGTSVEAVLEELRSRRQ
jgi:hypothetical protein